MLPHDPQGIARAVVGCHGVGAVPEYRQGDGLTAACVPQLVLHAMCFSKVFYSDRASIELLPCWTLAKLVSTIF